MTAVRVEISDDIESNKLIELITKLNDIKEHSFTIKLFGNITCVHTAIPIKNTSFTKHELVESILSTKPLEWEEILEEMLKYVKVFSNRQSALSYLHSLITNGSLTTIDGKYVLRN